jgi:hypothetical protein
MLPEKLVCDTYRNTGHTAVRQKEFLPSGVQSLGKKWATAKDIMIALS